MRTSSTIAVCLLLLLCGCSLPQWRVFQKTVPTDTGPAPAVIESQRRAAALIVDLSASLSADPARQVSDIHAVAVPLSVSLGEPLKRATVFQAPDVVASLRKSSLDAQAKAEKWREFARKHGGTPLEGTGVNLAGPAGLLGLIAVVALCVIFPPVGYLLLRALPVLWGFFRSTTSAISEFTTANPDEGERLKLTLSRKMDAAHKRLVKTRKVTAAP
jgi:hypothetical protein